MVSKFVAVEGMESAIIGITPPPPPAGSPVSGAWVAGTPVLTKGSFLTVDGDFVLLEVEVEFTFTGVYAPPTGTPYTDTSTVTLTAGNTLLTDDGDDLLLLADSESDSYGNTVLIIAGQIKLKTS